MITRKYVILALAALLLAAPALSSAQENLGRGRISGTVVDENGDPVEGAQVVAQSQQSTAKLEGTSDKKGRFAIAGFGTGVWQFEVTKAGYVGEAQQVEVRQLRTNLPVTMTMKKMTGLAALQADKAGLSEIDRGNTLLQEGKVDEAIQVFEAFIAERPEIYQIRLNVAAAYVKKGDLDRGESEFQRVLEQSAAANQGDYKRDKAVAMRALSGLGEIALKRDDLPTAQKYLQEGLQVSPEDETAAYNVGEILFSNQKIDEAIGYFEMAIRIKPAWSKPYHRLGLVYLNKGDFAKSLEYLNKFVELDPESPEVPAVRNVIAAIEKMKK